MEVLIVGRMANLSQARREFRCNFCPLAFEDSAKANAHLLEHFEQEFCHKCDQNLIRIGENLYVRHGPITCIDKDIKKETFFYDDPIDQISRGETERIVSREDDNQLECIEPIHETYIKIELIDINKEMSPDPPVEEQPSEWSQRLRNRTKIIDEEKTNDEKVNEINERQIKKSKRSDSRNTHKSGHGTSRLICDHCKKTFLGKDTLRSHMLRFHVQLSNQHECDKCGFSFSRKAHLKRHKTNRIICNTCGEIFCARSLLAGHQDQFCNLKNIDILESRRCELDGCNELVAAYQWVNHMEAKHKKQHERFECDICKKTCPNRSLIRTHILTNHCPSSRKFKCSVCQYTCISDSILRAHTKHMHKKSKEFMCSECGKVFKNRYCLRHHSFTHTGEYPYECSFDGCTRRFRRSNERNSHIRMHTGEKPFVCPVEECDRRFTRWIDLRRHKFRAHGISAKKYPCQICSEVFPENQFLKKHIMKKHANQV